MNDAVLAAGFPDLPAPGSTPRVLAICVGRGAPIQVGPADRRQTELSGIVKRPVSTLAAPAAVALGPLGLAGDEQVDLTVHGGLDQAVYLYPAEHYAFWRTVRGQAGLPGSLPPGMLGENLLVSGLMETGVYVGDVLQIGEVVLRVTRPRSPCYKFVARMGFAWASKMMIQSGFTGFYCAVVRPGELTAGSEILVSPGERAATIRQGHELKHPAARR
jgi:MOSC domain-containing protein YiiM